MNDWIVRIKDGKREEREGGSMTKRRFALLRDRPRVREPESEASPGASRPATAA
jgi:hypothetical protein